MIEVKTVANQSKIWALVRLFVLMTTNNNNDFYISINGIDEMKEMPLHALHLEEVITKKKNFQPIVKPIMDGKTVVCALFGRNSKCDTA